MVALSFKGKQFNLTFVLLYSSWLQNMSNWNKTQKENIYVWIQDKRFGTKTDVML